MNCISFSYCIALAGSFSMVLNKSGKKGQACLVICFEGHIFLWLLSRLLTVGIYHKWVFILLIFSGSIHMIIWLFLFC